MERKFIDSPRPGWNRINLSQGFTLLEVICSLSIAGLVVLTVLSIVNQSYGLWQRSWSWGEEDRGIRLVARTLEDFCANIFGGKLPKGEKEGFVGEPFEFSGLLEGEKGLARAGMRWDAQEKAIYYWRETDKGLREKVICEKVAEAEFSYLHRERGSWTESWTEQAPLPAAIRLRCKTSQKTMPAVIVPIQNGRRISAP